MPTERATAAAKKICRGTMEQVRAIAASKGYEITIHFAPDKMAGELDSMLALPALEAVAEAARKVLEECCYPDTEKFRRARSELRAALANLEEKPYSDGEGA